MTPITQPVPAPAPSGPRLRSAARNFVAGHRRHPLLRALASGARSYVEAYENANYEVDSNGETWLLNRLGSVDPRVVFDVGANVGDWSDAARQAFRRGQVHAFELVPSTALALSARFQHDPRIRVTAAGLSDEPGPVKVKTYPANSTIASVQDFPHDGDGPHEWVTGELLTGDAYCADHGIDRIDLLKIDTEGNDHNVLHGFTEMLGRGAIDVVQFEYGRSSIVSRFLLRDFYALLEGNDMTVGKLYPDYVDFRPYDMRWHEDFIGPNFVAVRRDEPDLVARLAG